MQIRDQHHNLLDPFRARDYRCIDNLTVKELFEQVHERVQLYRAMVEDEDFYPPEETKAMYDLFMGHGVIVPSDVDEIWEGINTSAGVIVEGPGTRLISCDQVSWADQVLSEGLQVSEGELPISLREIELDPGQAWLALQVEDRTDAEVLDELKIFLPALRMMLGMPEPKRASIKVSEGLLVKLYRFKIVQLLDLILLEKALSCQLGEKVSITNAVVSEVVFSGLVNDVQIQNTYRKFAMQLLTGGILKRLQLLINAAPELASMGCAALSESKKR